MLFHIDELRSRLYINKWIVLEEKEGNDLDISGYWAISHRYLNKQFTLVFEGMGDLEVLPMVDSYACFLLEDKSLSLYFSKNNLYEWRKNLASFVEKINNY